MQVVVKITGRMRVGPQPVVPCEVVVTKEAVTWGN